MLREKRMAYGVKQETLAADVGITRVYLSNVENGRKHASEELLNKLDSCLRKYNPDETMDILFDYCRIRFPTTDAGSIIRELLKLDVALCSIRLCVFMGIRNSLSWATWR